MSKFLFFIFKLLDCYQCRNKLFPRRTFQEDQTMARIIRPPMKIVEEGIGDVFNQHLLNRLARKEKATRTSCLIWRSSWYYLFRIWFWLEIDKYFLAAGFLGRFLSLLYHISWLHTFQVEPENFQDTAFLNAVVKVKVCNHCFELIQSA